MKEGGYGYAEFNLQGVGACKDILSDTFGVACSATLFLFLNRNPKKRKMQANDKIEIKSYDEALLPPVRALIEEYTRRLGRDLTFQHIREELDDIAAKYAPPNGELLVAVEESTVLGMVAYHRHSETRCEMKRLYVVPAARGRYLGERLVSAIIRHAADAGYTEMVLDTIKPLEAAIALYKKHGFEECAPYYDNPMSDVMYMRRELAKE